MAKKQSKNLQKVQNMLDGKHERKIQSGYLPTEETHKVGDIWTDSDGKKWEQKNGYRANITKLANAGIADQCSDCEAYIVKKWDKDVFFWNGRCYYCQIDFEAELHGTGKYDEWLKEKYNLDILQQKKNTKLVIYGLILMERNGNKKMDIV